MTIELRNYLNKKIQELDAAERTAADQAEKDILRQRKADIEDVLERLDCTGKTQRIESSCGEVRAVKK